MPTDPDPSTGPSAESAVGLTFVAVVLVCLFVAGALGVVATRHPAPATAAGQEPEATADASESTAGLARTRIVTRFKVRKFSASSSSSRLSTRALYRLTHR